MFEVSPVHKNYRCEMNCDNRIRNLFYQEGKLVKDKLLHFPGPSTRLRIDRLVENETQPTILKVKWDYQDLGFPHRFMVEYRQKYTSDDLWFQRITNVLSSLSSFSHHFCEFSYELEPEKILDATDDVEISTT